MKQEVFFKSNKGIDYSFNYYDYESINEVEDLIENEAGGVSDTEYKKWFYHGAPVNVYRLYNSDVLTTDGGMGLLFDQESFSAFITKDESFLKNLNRKFKKSLEDTGVEVLNIPLSIADVFLDTATEIDSPIDLNVKMYKTLSGHYVEVEIETGQFKLKKQEA